MFDLAALLKEAGVGRTVVRVKPKQVFFSQGSPADFIFYLQTGRVKLTVVSPDGKRATVALLSVGEFIGEEALAGGGGLYATTATALVVCTALRMERPEAMRMMHVEQAFSEVFMRFLLERSMRTEADLVAQLLDSSERRLARILVVMAEFGKPGPPQRLLPRISQATLAAMVGTTRSRVSFFMNRFRKLGLIEYKGRIRVNKSLLNVLVRDQFGEPDPERSSGSATPRGRSKADGTGD